VVKEGMAEVLDWPKNRPLLHFMGEGRDLYAEVSLYFYVIIVSRPKL
jgi:hypothetical protein